MFGYCWAFLGLVAHARHVHIQVWEFVAGRDVEGSMVQQFIGHHLHNFTSSDRNSFDALPITHATVDRSLIIGHGGSSNVSYTLLEHVTRAVRPQ